MNDAKYSRHIAKNSSRFATPEEIKNICVGLQPGKNSEGCGAVLHYEDNCMYVDNSDAHYFVQGGTGSKKTRTQGVNIIKSILAAGESQIINDPKGELYRQTAGLAQQNGYNIKVLNLRNAAKSHGWNPLGLSREFEKNGDIAASDEAVNDLKEALVGPCLANTKDNYWPDMASEVIKYCTLLLRDTVPDEYYNIANLVQLTHMSNGPSLIKLLQKIDPTSTVAASMHTVLDVQAPQTLSCIYSSVKQALIPLFDNKALLHLLCHNDIDFKELVTKPTAIYVIYPDEKNTLSFLVNLFFTQCYRYLIHMATNLEKPFLPRRVNFVLDEFSNLPAIQNFENRISEARGYNIRYFLFCQSFGQLKNKYHDNADTIIANCDWVIYSSKDIHFFEDISKMCGKEVDNNGREHNIIDACDIQHMKKYNDGAEALVIKAGQYPFVTKLPDYEYHGIFKSYPVAELTIHSTSLKPVFIGFNDWFSELGKRFNTPYPMSPRLKDKRFLSAKEKDSFDDSFLSYKERYDIRFGKNQAQSTTDDEDMPF